MARAAFFLTKTDADSIRSRQLKNALSLVFLVLVDAATTTFLFVTRDKHLSSFVHEVANLTSAETFKGGTGDLLALLALRVILYAFAGTLAVALGKQRNKGPPPPPKAFSSFKAGSSANLAGAPSPSNLLDPLLRRQNGDDDDGDDDAAVAGVCVDDAPNDATTFDPNLFAPSEEDQYYNHRALKRRDLIVELTFLLCIAMQAYVAVKSVAFYYAPHRTLRTVLLFGCSVLCINAQSVYLRSWVASCTVRTGEGKKGRRARCALSNVSNVHDSGSPSEMCVMRLALVESVEALYWLFFFFFFHVLVLYIANFPRRGDDKTWKPLIFSRTAHVRLIPGTRKETVAFASENRSLCAGVLRRDFHAHELQFHDRVVGHVCDMCGLRLVAGSKGLRFGGFRCKTCDFDCCMRCFCRKDRNTAEGGIRSDKGTKADQERTPAEYLWRVMGLAKLEWQLLTLAIVTTLVTSAAALFVPHFQGSAFDAAISLDSALFNRQATLLLISSMGVALFSAFKRACFSLVGQRLNYKVRTGLLKNILSQDIAYFDSVNTGDLLSRLSYDCTNLTAPCNTVMSLAAQNFVVILGGLTMCFWVCWRLAMVSFAVVMPITFLIKRYARWSQTLNREISAMLGLASNVANEALGNIRTVRAVSTEEVEFARYEEHARAALRAGVKDAFGGALTVALTNLLELGTSVLILWLGGGMTMERPDPRLTIGSLITFQLYFNSVTSSYTALSSCLTSLVRAAGSASRVFSLQDNLPDITPGTGATYRPASHRGPEITFRDVTFWYQMRPNTMVINAMNMTIPGGSTAALVGKSGGGKTTVISLLLRYYDVKAGSIRFDGVDVRELNLASTHKHIGLVMQDMQIFNHSIAGNIGYGLSEEEATQEAIETAARAANAHDFIQTFPDGYDTRLGERGIRLSGGQRQRLAIARVFLRNPQLLLLDEATSALDLESEAAVQEALDRLVALGGHTAVVVAHRLSTVRHANRINVVAGGVVCESGTHEELLGVEGGTYAGLLSLQERKKKEVIPEE